MVSRPYNPLTPAQLLRLRDTIAQWPHLPQYAWQAERNVALLWFFVCLGTRAKETSVYTIKHIYNPQGAVREDLPIDSNLLRSGTHRPGFQLINTPAECRTSLTDWYRIYTHKLGYPPPETYPLWLSNKHTAVVHGLERESLWRQIKPAALACGLDWVNPESLRTTMACLGVLEDVTVDELQRVMQAIIRAKERMRLKDIKQAWAKIERLWRASNQ
jgi:hypothetical protein